MKPAFLFLLIAITAAACTGGQAPLFQSLDSTRTGITFNNLITENDSVNILDLEYVYNGGGVAIADFNNDGLPDVFFTGNMAGNKLYLNEGKLHFKDISSTAAIGGEGKWCTGVAVVDINNDGWMDIYISTSVKKDPAARGNILYINKGLDKNGVPIFEDEAAAYHLADTGYNTHAAFFDYDNDGDLDVYILTNKMNEKHYANQYRTLSTDGSSPNADRLYRNDWDSAAGHPVFTDVSRAAGILTEGYGLGVNITDINQDGWKDIYVTNDFLTNDLLWINNGDGTFTNKADDYFAHTSFSAMGNDVEDINNDGLVDIVALDMLPRTNFRKKKMMGANNYQFNVNNDLYHYGYQYSRNTLQLNQGMAVGGNDSLTHPVFSEVGFLAGIAETDWSWTPLLTDFDNDGYRDLIVTNGYPKDITDRDFITFRRDANEKALKSFLLKQIPQVKLHNMAFRNNKDGSFSEVSSEWGITQPAFSSGAAYADLDNDGDLDVVINCTNGPALVYENVMDHSKPAANHSLTIRFRGPAQNRNGLGAWAEIHYDKGKRQVYENTPYRGYLSSVEGGAHFGLGSLKTVDSLIIRWPGGKTQLLTNVAADQVLTVNIDQATVPSGSLSSSAGRLAKPLFTEITSALKISYVQKESDFPDFNIQKLLPHKLSEYGPGIAVGDVDGNGLDDLVLGGSFNYSAKILLQQPDGTFTEKDLIPIESKTDKSWEDMGLLLFDADGDGDLDLYITSGSYEHSLQSQYYLDKLYINDGKGNFSISQDAIPPIVASKSCVRAVDFDKDGDLDLFIAGRVEPWRYPSPVSSYILRNDSKNGKIKFTDITATVAPDLARIGMVCDAVWTDFDNDGWEDLVLAGEWMPVTFLKNDKGVFKNITASTGIGDQAGMWNSIAPGDYDNDGRMDYLVGNLGRNSFYRASPEYPARIYAGDFDNNGNYDAVPSLYLTAIDGEKKEFPAQTRDDLVKQVLNLQFKFPTYESFATAGMKDIFTKEQLKGGLILKADNFNTSYIHNKGDGRFEMTAMPMQAQVAPINGMAVADFNGDGNSDIVMNGNDYGTEVSVGRYDALKGLYMQGDGKGHFTPGSIAESGIYIPGNGKALVRLQGVNGQCLLAASQNRGPLKVFRLNKPVKCIKLLPDEVSALFRYRDGHVRKEEFTYGASFLSQSGRFIIADSSVAALEITNAKGQKRKIL